MADGLNRDEQLPGDLAVGVPGADQVEDVTLAPGQPERVLLLPRDTRNWIHPLVSRADRR
jgi:hypothetical protein